jgi:hypothetical protein
MAVLVSSPITRHRSYDLPNTSLFILVSTVEIESETIWKQNLYANH